MKKVLIIGMTGILGGVETYIYNMIRFIDKEKFDFDFLIIGQGKISVYEKEINELLHDDRNHFYYAPSLKRNYFRGRQWLKEFYDFHNYDMIYMNTCTAARINYCKYAIKKQNIKLLTHSHNGSSSSKLGGINHKIFRHYTTKYSDVRLACSELAYHWMFDDMPDKSAIVPNGIDPQRFKFSVIDKEQIRRKLGIADEKIVVGHVGRFSEQKNQDFFIKLIKELDKKFVVLCIGEGETKELILKKIKKEKLEKRFVIIDVQSDIEKYYSAMDVFLMPSMFEGLPIVAVEAQCNGLTCIFSNNVSRQIDLSGKSKFIGLDRIDAWINALKNMNFTRYNGVDVIEKAGFSIRNTVQIISKIMENNESV